MKKISLSGRTAIVTGATSGVGRAIALDLASAGAHVMLVARREKALKELVTSILENGGSAGAWPTDLGKDDSVEHLAAIVRETVSGVDVLVHSAGIFTLGVTEAASVHDLDAQYRINIRGPFLLTQKLIPALRHAKGQVVFVNSTAGKSARAGVGSYAASKHALKAVADSLREEVNGEGIRVLSVFLGRTNTPMQAEVFRLEGRSYNPDLLIQPEDVARLTRQILLLPDTAEVTEITIRPMKKA